MDFSTFTDPIFIAKVIDFALLVGVIAFLYQRVGRVGSPRSKRRRTRPLKTLSRSASRLRRPSQTATQAIVQAKIDAARMLETGKAQAARLIVEERNAALDHAQRILAHANGELERERYRVRIELLEDTVERATSHARDIIKRDVTPAKQHELVEGLLGGLEARRA